MQAFYWRLLSGIRRRGPTRGFVALDYSKQLCAQLRWGTCRVRNCETRNATLPVEKNRNLGKYCYDDCNKKNQQFTIFALCVDLTDHSGSTWNAFYARCKTAFAQFLVDHLMAMKCNMAKRYSSHCFMAESFLRGALSSSHFCVFMYVLGG